MVGDGRKGETDGPGIKLAMVGGVGGEGLVSQMMLDMY